MSRPTVEPVADRRDRGRSCGDPVRETRRRHADEPTGLEDGERPRALADEVRRGTDTGLDGHAAARHERGHLVAEEPGRSLGRIARVLVVGQHAHEPALALDVGGREDEREYGLGDPRARRGQCRDERGESLVASERAGEEVKGRPVHDDWRGVRPAGPVYVVPAAYPASSGHAQSGQVRIGHLRGHQPPPRC